MAVRRKYPPMVSERPSSSKEYPPVDRPAIIILAAGNSSRLGRPKQLLPYRGKTLLWHVVEQALSTKAHPVVVVTGARHTEIQDTLKDQPVTFAYNPDWETGMASGIVAGLLKTLSIEPLLTCMIVSVCDQPHISAEVFQALMDKYSVSGKGMVACQYADAIGTPVLFDRKYFKELLALSGKAGARQLLKQYPGQVTTIPFPGGDVDIDKQEDVQKTDFY
jgi:molybdenum cofactor cytidylyltransferase